MPDSLSWVDLSTLYLKLTGGTMSGNIAMGGNAMTNAKTAMQAVSGAKSVDNTYTDAYVATDSSGVTWTLENTGYQGQTLLVMQGGGGQITFAAGSGVTVWFSVSASHTKTSHQGAIVTLLCWGTLLGGNVLWVVAGATA